MRLRYLLIGSGCLAVGYKAGEIIGCIKCGKMCIDMIDDAFPGLKVDVAKKAACSIIDKTIGNEKTEKKGD